jgi:hypothetical protein
MSGSCTIYGELSIASRNLRAANAVALGGTNPGDFTIAAGTTCVDSLVLGANPGPGNSCLINIIFTLSALGPRSATVMVTDNSNPTTQSTSLTGNGVFPQARAFLLGVEFRR